MRLHPLHPCLLHHCRSLSVIILVCLRYTLFFLICLNFFLLVSFFWEFRRINLTELRIYNDELIFQLLFSNTCQNVSNRFG